MKKIHTIHIPIYEWNSTFALIDSKKDLKQVNKLLDEAVVTEEERAIVNEAIEAESYDGAETFMDEGSMSTLTILHPISNDEEMFAILSHEKRHIVDFIVEMMGLEGREAPAYLDEYLSRELYREFFANNGTQK